MDQNPTVMLKRVEQIPRIAPLYGGMDALERQTPYYGNRPIFHSVYQHAPLATRHCRQPVGDGHSGTVLLGDDRVTVGHHVRDRHWPYRHGAERREFPRPSDVRMCTLQPFVFPSSLSIR